MSLLYELITKTIENNNLPFDWIELSKNPSAIPLLEKYPNIINWSALSSNPNAIELLEKYPDKINWDELSKNHNAIGLLTENPDKINWSALSSNPNAISLLEQNPEKIDWLEMSKNPNATELLTANPHKIEWETLDKNINVTRIIEMIPFNFFKNCVNDKILNSISKNSFTIDFLGEHPDFIIWEGLCENEKICDFEEKYTQLFEKIVSDIYFDFSDLFLNPFAIPLIEKYRKKWIKCDNEHCFLSANPNAIDILTNDIDCIDFDLIDYAFLSENPNAIELLEANIDEVDFYHLSKNTNPTIWRNYSYILK